MVDTRKFSIILPINGFAVPFHINTLKSLQKVEEGDYTVLRFMFVTPGAVTGKKEDTVGRVDYYRVVLKLTALLTFDSRLKTPMLRLFEVLRIDLSIRSDLRKFIKKSMI